MIARPEAPCPTAPKLAHNFRLETLQKLPKNLPRKYREIFCKLYTQHNTDRTKNYPTHRRPITQPITNHVS